MIIILIWFYITGMWVAHNWCLQETGQDRADGRDWFMIFTWPLMPIYYALACLYEPFDG